MEKVETKTKETQSTALENHNFNSMEFSPSKQYLLDIPIIFIKSMQAFRLVSKVRGSLDRYCCIGY